MPTLNFLDENGLLYFSGLIKAELNKKANTADLATTSANGLMSSADKTKLDGIETGAQVNIINRIRIGTGAPLTVSNDGTIFIPIDGTMYGNQQGDSLVTDGTLTSRLNGLGAGLSQDISQKANINSPEFTGTPTAPTPTSGDNSTKIATTAFVQGAISGLQTAINNGIQTINNFSIVSSDNKLDPGVYYDSTNKCLLIADGNDLLTIDGGGGGLYYASWDSSNNSYTPAGCLGELSSTAQSDRIILSTRYSSVDESQVYINSATTSVAGVMSASDKNYLDVIKNAVYNLFFQTPSSTIEIHFAENNRNVNLFNSYAPTDPPSIWISPAAPNSGASSGIFLFDGGNEVYFFTGGTIIKGTYNNNTNSWDEETIFSENILAAKAPLASPAFTGTPTAPTPASGTNTTQIATTAFVQSAIAAAVTGSFKFVNTLPVTGEEGYIYLVPHTHTSGTTSSNPDVKDEYIWNTSTSPAQWELIGNTDLDLTTHWAKSELEAATNAEILAQWTAAVPITPSQNSGS